MACSFSGMDDERGFIMLHVDINQHSPNLVKSVIDLQNSNSDKQLNKALDLGYKTMIKINERRQLMWTASRWEHYNDFRIFIMGILKDKKELAEHLMLVDLGRNDVGRVVKPGTVKVTSSFSDITY